MASMEVMKNIPAGDKENGVVILNDGSTVFVIKTVANIVIVTIMVGKDPNGVTIME